MKTQIKAGVVLSYVQTIISIVLSFVITPVTIRLLGQSEFGIYSLAGSMIPYLTLLDLGFSNAIVRYITKYRVENDKEKEYTLNGTFLVIYSVIAIIVLIIGIPIALSSRYIFTNGLTGIEINKVEIMMLISVFYVALSFPFMVFEAIIVAYERFLFVRIVSMIMTLITPVITLLILFNGMTSVALTLATAIVGLLANIAAMIYCLKVLKIKVIIKKFQFPILKELFSYSFYIFLASIVDVIYWSTDTIILGIVSNSKEVAIYSVAMKFNQYFSSFTVVISSFLLPKVFKMVAENKSNKEITDLFIKVARIQLQIVGLIIIGFILIGKQFVIKWAGTDYDKAYVIALMIMCVRIIPICQVLGISILQAKNKHKLRSILYIIVALFNLVISIPLAKMYGGVGCAIGTVAGTLINIIVINIYYSRVGLEMKRYWINFIELLIPITITGVISLVILKFIVVKSIVSMIIFIVVFLPAYAIIIWNFGSNHYEKQLVREPLKKIFSRKTL
ncbi:oligosaccharide flippase family protein [Clostridium bowmanii]|uniref:oligosaccharide flippase family protein n=1 Tax=Clostridium bowmanii TaxID=132925 RepID=UPI001C0ACCB9|nr:oligosaccharide flippase family protein [Clostridium bowmanii]MBU3191223.1 oligosaccharide flippase family protein [Clostridium bowmanii]MCA1075671.1 oligosaccharide flippase family protein [Clostridium bowmanii]